MRGMWNRLHAHRLRGLARQFPAVLILGPRQVGKTTLARAAIPAADMEDSSCSAPRNQPLSGRCPNRWLVVLAFSNLIR
jgi:hypothetical protein